jgi:hypothetical protein
MRVTRWIVLPLVLKVLYKLGFFEGIVKSSKTIRQISRMIFKVALKQFCMESTFICNSDLTEYCVSFKHSLGETIHSVNLIEPTILVLKTRVGL